MSEQRRYHGFDALRGGMMMLGLVIHSAMFYIVSPPPTMPISVDHNQSPVMDVLMHFVHTFRMPVFFLMAGFFASLLLDGRGLIATWKNRAARVLAPLLAGMFTVVPLAVVLWMSFAVSVRYGSHDLIPNLDHVRVLAREAQTRQPELRTPGALHLWFLYFLCLYYLLLPLLQQLAARLAPALRNGGAALSSWSVFALLSLLTFVTLWPFQGARVHEGFLSFLPRPAALIYFGQFFVLGYLLNASRAIATLRLGHPAPYALLGSVLLLASLQVSPVDEAISPTDPAWHAAACAINATATWAWTFCFVAASLRWFDTPSPWVLYVSQSSYWVFLVHVPLACFAAWWLVAFDLHAVLKFVLVLAFTATLSILSYHNLIQRSWVSVFLNGKRFDLDWPWRDRDRRSQSH